MTTHLSPRPPRESRVEMNQLVLPGDANALDTAFGGQVVSWIDICAAIAARRHCRQTVVTASMDEIHFHGPIRVGWIAVLHARVLAAFHSSMEIGVTVHAENPDSGERTLTCSALLTFVALDKSGARVAVPALALETDAERAAFEAAHARRKDRLSRKDRDDAWTALVSG